MELENIYEVMELENKDEVKRKIEAMEKLGRSGSRGEGGGASEGGAGWEVDEEEHGASWWEEES